MSKSFLNVATRTSALALWQTRHVIDQLGKSSELRNSVDFKELAVDTLGDKNQNVPIWNLGGQGVFVKEVQSAVLTGKAAFAVHSAKDLPSLEHPELTIAAILEREDPRDMLVGSSLESLTPGALVATGSVRRRAQLAFLRPDICFSGLRGNIQTRLEKANNYSAIVMAVAAIKRLNITYFENQILEPWQMLPQVGQGAIAVECRKDDKEVIEILSKIDHKPTRMAIEAERSFLSELGSGCDLPIGAYATNQSNGDISLEAMIASIDGHIVLKKQASSTDPKNLGKNLALELLAVGGSRLLDIKQ